MIREESPGIADCLCSLEIGCEPIQEIISVLMVKKHFAAFNTPADHVVKGSGDIDS